MKSTQSTDYIVLPTTSMANKQKMYANYFEGFQFYLEE